MTTSACRICNASGERRSVRVREMMFGLREEFEYFQCVVCGCLQIARVLPDLVRFYGPGYYSLSERHWVPPGRSAIWRYLKGRRLDHVLGKETVLGHVLRRMFGEIDFKDGVPMIAAGAADLDWTSAILDVGCGNGGRLLEWCAYGFGNLKGIDPFVDGNVEYACGVRVQKGSVSDVKGTFQLIMLNHSLEHMEDQVGACQRVRELLSDEGAMIVRVPTVSSFAWEHYGVNWVQLDAPRHLYLHSVKSMKLLAERCGLELVDVVFDSEAFQFWGSEQYARDIPLMDPRSYSRGVEGSIFERTDIIRFEQDASRLNREKRGDQACFVLRKRV